MPVTVSAHYIHELAKGNDGYPAFLGAVLVADFMDHVVALIRGMAEQGKKAARRSR